MIEKVVELPFSFSTEILKSSATVIVKDNIERIEDSVPKIEPIKGELFFKRPNVELKPGDWVIFGVASTPNVDLVNDAILDVKHTFGDSLEEFVKSGRIFYEHGYKYAGNPEKHPDIDIPIGIPIAAEIADNKLYIWILLDKNHELAQKVYKHLQNEDYRFNKIGLSIGAIPLGKGTTKLVGNTVVNVPPKMRLYEVSITGQPINIDTFAKIVKSLVYNAEEKSIEEDKMPNEKEKKLMDLLSQEEQPAEEQLAEEKALEATDTEDVQAKEEPAKDLPEEKLDLQAEDVALDEETEEVEEKLEEHEEEDEASFSYILDKLDFIEEKLNELMSKLPTTQPEEEQTSVVSSLSEMKSFITSIEKQVSSLENKLNQVFDLLEANIEALTEVKSLFSTLSNVEEFVKKSLASLEDTKKNLEEVQKSFNEKITSTISVGVNANYHPTTGMFDTTTEEKLKSLLSDKAKLKTLEAKLEEFLNYKGTPTQLSKKKEELIEFAKKNFNLEPYEVEMIYRKYKSTRKN